jgi:D-arabinose 1-dehydrogenase-like Zn-dependent alcohol dehydrogenase
MAKMRAVQVTRKQGAFEPVEKEIPEPGPRQVRIKVEACGVCHSDMVVKGGWYPGLTYPRVPGHEIAGRVDTVGVGVTMFKPGDRVGVGWHGGHCFECDPCRRGDFLNCVNAKVTGVTFDGGFAEYAVVPAEAVARLPDSLSAVEAGPLLCAGITTYNALRNSGATAGQTVAVQGIGGLGHLGIQFAAKMGFRTVALSSGSDKEALARQLGAHEYIDTKKTAAADGLQKLGGADLVLATAPHAQAIADTVKGLKPRGKLLIVAAPLEPIPVSAGAMFSGKSLTVWPSGTSIDWEDTLAFSALTGVRARVETFKLEEAEAAMTKVLQNQIRFRAVLVI